MLPCRKVLHISNLMLFLSNNDLHSIVQGKKDKRERKYQTIQFIFKTQSKKMNTNAHNYVKVISSPII